MSKETYVSPTALAWAQDEQARQLERYLDSLVLHAYTWRRERWQRDCTSLAAYEASVAPQRARWRELLGSWPGEAQALPLATERHFVLARPTHTVYRVTFAVFPGVRAHALLLLPHSGGERRPAVICQHGMNGAPHAIAGLLEQEDAYHRSSTIQGNCWSSPMRT